MDDITPNPFDFISDSYKPDYSSYSYLNTSSEYDTESKSESIIILNNKNIIIEDVKNDNACFWRAVATSLHYLFQGNSLSELLEKKPSTNFLKDDKLDDNWGYNCPLVSNVARELQEKVLDFVINNPDLIIDESGLSIEHLIPFYHDCEYIEYLEKYKIFAADKDNNSNRWGSILESKIISIIFNINIAVYNSQKIIKDKITNGKIIRDFSKKNIYHHIMKPEKDVYLKQTLFIPSPEISNYTLHLLWRKSYGSGHYMSILYL